MNGVASPKSEELMAQRMKKVPSISGQVMKLSGPNPLDWI